MCPSQENNQLDDDNYDYVDNNIDDHADDIDYDLDYDLGNDSCVMIHV